MPSHHDPGRPSGPHPEDDVDTSHSLARLAVRFEHFAAEGCPEEPLYVALCRIAAQQPGVLALLQAAPQTQRKPNLLLAAVHERLLRDADAGTEPDPLAAYFGSVGGARGVDGDLAGHFLRFIETHTVALRACIAVGRTQTNEIGRCAVLWPALAEIAQRRGASQFALFDFGCSAGLNLEVDRYRYRYQRGTQGETVAWWALTEPGRDAPASVLLARSHPHGRWLQWRG